MMRKPSKNVVDQIFKYAVKKNFSQNTPTHQLRKLYRLRMEFTAT